MINGSTYFDRNIAIDLDEQGLLKRNYTNPPLKDTITIPDAGYAIIRIFTSNLG